MHSKSGERMILLNGLIDIAFEGGGVALKYLIQFVVKTVSETILCGNNG